MPEGWKQWEGRVVNEEFPLLRYLGGSERSAVFLSKRADGEPQEVAIKLVVANAENPELQLSWWELAAKLSHPHLLRLFRLGRCQLDGTDLLYVVTEYAEESLAQILPYRALTPAEAQDMLRNVVDALSYIHGKGFVHGHINPSNIMAVGDQVKISSDGLCGAGESMRVLCQPGDYAAPEIAAGGNMSPPSDVWSLGMTLVEALTQHAPAAQKAGQTDVVLPETLPQPFLDIASHCLRRDPQARWTVADITRRLRQPPAPAEPPVTAIPQPGFTKWGYAVAAIAVVLVLALVGQRLMHHGSVAPTSTTESSAGQPTAVPSVQNGQAKERSSAGSNASHSAAHYWADEKCRGQPFRFFRTSGRGGPADNAGRVAKRLAHNSRQAQGASESLCGFIGQSLDGEFRFAGTEPIFRGTVAAGREAMDLSTSTGRWQRCSQRMDPKIPI